MSLRLLLLALFIAAFTTSSWAQQVQIKGVIVDKDTKEPLPFSSIGLKNEQIGALSNEHGIFIVPAPTQNTADSLVVVALGYARRAVLVKKGVALTNLTIEVPKRAVELGNVTVKGGKVKNLGLGAKSDNPGEGMIQGLPGSQYAFFVKNEKKKKLGNVRTVSFYIGENGFPREPFRVRLYKADGNYNAPNTDLLTENVVVSAPQGGQWYTVDLTPYNISAPEEGFFVAMEWVVSGDKFFATNFMDDYTPYGQIMRPTFEFKESRTWNYSIGKGWSLITASNGQGLRYNAMIKAEVDMIK
ncbi:carboxypeptidase-like regulatory domain-containing protein [Hymenobacter properus]|uniref:Carboxypeptidase-like regulatory domain-containing protein n=1 Tax=Hymenobacter properus TaxID=2791026 RepID=A0A931FM81_9BACT|nr:carboxypeptidase-like regulatory domain-containing protein [Hymenobacter properus]MBF9142831.1 carboxypeptidase-like regulatory domain-containing protein [Hymenobacter properus]MBR7721640.1 carboxypeptidase-like regulatory domain-containing protein [Microvirga sp. SRT04]